MTRRTLSNLREDRCSTRGFSTRPAFAALLAVVGVLAGPCIATAPAASGSSATAVTTAARHTCALLSDRTVRCWGANDQGQLGDGTRTRRLTAVAVRGLSNVIEVSGSSSYTCALVDDGGGSGPVECWGAWVGSQPKFRSLVPVAVKGVTDAIAVSAGIGIACALLSDHTVECWGDNSRGAFGNGTRDSSSSPVVVPELSNVQSVDAGEAHVCVVMQDRGTVRCWGWSGELGPIEQAGDVLTPALVPRLTGALSVDADVYHSCAVLIGGTPKCWSNFDTPKPRAEPGLNGVKTFAWAEDGQQTVHSCARLPDGSVRCRSPYPLFGQLGNGTRKKNGNKLVTVSGLRDATAISAADGYTCAVRSTGGVVCWGSNGDGVLGDGTTTMRSRPVVVKGLALR